MQKSVYIHLETSGDGKAPPSLKVDPLKILFPKKFDSIACKEVREHDRKVREDEKRLHAKFWYQTVDAKMSYEVLK